ncbi:DUF5673 domain-containing protein [Tepidibacter sp. Z1-5]|uniref:DUF5673 domain-containing protein n=1 Tax=Tepidibacter sp. Z1-5 TaxID=3134138 RepID=UPI0030BBA24A
MGHMDILLVVIIVSGCLNLIDNIKKFMVDNEILLRFSGLSVIWGIPMGLVNILGIYTTVGTENNIDYRMKGVIIGILVSGILVGAYYEKTISYKGIIIKSELYEWEKIISYSYDEDDSHTILFRTKKDKEVKLRLNKSNIKDAEKLFNKNIKNKEISNEI